MPYKITLFDTEIESVGVGTMSLDYVNFQLQMASGQDIEVDISSCGGSHFDAVAIFNILKPKDVDTNCLSVAGSAASTIFLAGKNRRMSKYALLMFHPAKMVSGGNADDLSSDSELLAKCTQNIIKILSDTSGISADKAAEIVNATTWLDAEEALALGIATEIIDFDDQSEDVIANASVVLNKVKDVAPAKYLQVVNHILLKPADRPQPENEMPQLTKEEIEAIVNKNDDVLKKVMNFFKLNTNKLVTNKGEIFFVGNLKKGTSVFNSSDMDTPVNDDDIEVEDSTDSSKKVKMSVKNGMIENFAGVTNTGNENDDDMDDEDCDPDNKTPAVKTVLNQHGIELKKSIGAKKVLNIALKKLVEVSNASSEKDATILELRNQLKVSNDAVKLTEEEIKNKIISEYKPENAHRDSRKPITEVATTIKQPAPGSMAEKAAQMAVKNKAVKA